MPTPASVHPAPTQTHPLAGSDRRVGLLGAAVRGVSRLAPGLGARMAEALFVKTSRPAPRPYEADFLATARRESLAVGGQTIAVYRWGTDGPVVLCSHGWWSHAGRFTPLATAALAAGFQVVAFDAPGHGRSTGWRATMPEFAGALRAVAARERSIHAVVGHSLGGAASIFALAHGLQATRAVVLAAPTDLSIWARRFQATVGLTDDVYSRMQANLEARLGLTWDQLRIDRHAERIRVPGLVIHDRDDADVPVHEGELLAERWPAADLHITSGLGHRGLLRDPDVVRRVVGFL